MCPFCNFLQKYTLGVGAIICGVEVTRLVATDHGAEVPRTHKQSSESSNLPLIFSDLFRRLEYCEPHIKYNGKN